MVLAFREGNGVARDNSRVLVAEVIGVAEITGEEVFARLAYLIFDIQGVAGRQAGHRYDFVYVAIIEPAPNVEDVVFFDLARGNLGPVGF